MPHRKLKGVISAFAKRLNDISQLVLAAEGWQKASVPSGTIRFAIHHKELVSELAFLHLYLAWESFLEESFILYLIGRKPPKGVAPRRYAMPPNRESAEALVLQEGRDYADWAAPDRVVDRSKRFFRNGKPFASALTGKQSFLQDLKTIRNAVAHSSKSSQEKYRRLVRRELATYPHSLTIGGFLATPKPGVSPPQSFFEEYLSNLQVLAETIVPS